MALTKTHNRMIAGAPVNVKDFGAAGDGITDDTAAIQAAIDSLTNNSSLLFPNGLYMIDELNISSLNNIKVYGSGKLKHRTQQVAYSVMLNVSSCDNITFDGLSFEGYQNSKAELDALPEIYYETCMDVGASVYNLNIKDCTFEYISYDSIRIDNATTNPRRIEISGCLFRIVRKGIWCKHGIQQITISNNTFFYTQNNAIGIDDLSVGEGVGNISTLINIVANTFWICCYADTSGVVFLAACQSFVIGNNTFQHETVDAGVTSSPIILSSGGDTTTGLQELKGGIVSDNAIVHSIPSAYAIKLQGAKNVMVVDNNLISNNSSAYGILLDDSSGHGSSEYSADCVIDRNQLIGFAASNTYVDTNTTSLNTIKTGKPFASCKVWLFNNAGTIQHRVTTWDSLSPNSRDLISNQSNFYADTPSVDSVTDFANGVGISAAVNYDIIIDQAETLLGFENVMCDVSSTTVTGTGIDVKFYTDSQDINGATRNRIKLRLIDLTGAPYRPATDMAAGDVIYLTLFGDF